VPAPDAVTGVRPARPDDAAEVVRLAELMYRSLGLTLAADAWDRWRVSAIRTVRTRLGPDLAVVVVEDPVVPGHLVACGAGATCERLPSPAHASARVGYIQWMSTEPGFRRRGLGRAVLRALLAWFESVAVDNVELHASADGDLLYRSEGFWEGSTALAMRRRPWDPPPGP
jgi:GNAT superfamily N-acetyltransferase